MSRSKSEAAGGRGAKGRPKLRAACLGLVVLLYASPSLGIREDEPLELVLGLPDWVAVALLCYVAVAIVNGVAWWATEVPDDLPETPDALDTRPHP